jgi:hypothetical protein|tara:strand:+ start:99 stop:401 length:303 start_codon:yes stop_codon:yes gene_type:complete
MSKASELKSLLEGIVDLGDTTDPVVVLIDAALKDLNSDSRFNALEKSDKARIVSKLKTALKKNRVKDVEKWQLKVPEVNKVYQTQSKVGAIQNHKYNPFK